MDNQTVKPFQHCIKEKNYQLNANYDLEYLSVKLSLLMMDKVTQRIYYEKFDKTYVEEKYNISFDNFLSIIDHNLKEKHVNYVYNIQTLDLLFSFDNIVKFNFRLTLLYKNNEDEIMCHELINKNNNLINENNLLKEKCCPLEKDLKKLKEDTVLIIGYYVGDDKDNKESFPLVITNPCEECDMLLGQTERNMLFTTLNIWTYKQTLTIAQNFHEFTESFRDVNCNMLVLDTYDFDSLTLWKYLPSSLKVINFRTLFSFECFLTHYEGKCSHLTKIALRNIEFDGSKKPYIAVKLIELGIKEVIIIGNTVSNFNTTDIAVTYLP